MFFWFFFIKFHIETSHFTKSKSWFLPHLFVCILCRLQNKHIHTQHPHKHTTTNYESLSLTSSLTLFIHYILKICKRSKLDPFNFFLPNRWFSNWIIIHPCRWCDCFKFTKVGYGYCVWFWHRLFKIIVYCSVLSDYTLLGFRRACIMVSCERKQRYVRDRIKCDEAWKFKSFSNLQTQTWDAIKNQCLFH